MYLHELNYITNYSKHSIISSNGEEMYCNWKSKNLEISTIHTTFNPENKLLLTDPDIGH
jgi:hypothetical protein